MSRKIEERKSQNMAIWIREHTGGPQRSYRPPTGRGVRRVQLRKTPKAIAARYFQLLSGHAAIGPYLKDKMRKTNDDTCWWCGGRKKQTRHHLLTACRAWAPQIERLWKMVGKAYGWKHPRARAIRWLWGEKATEAMLLFLKDTRVGCITARRINPEDVGLVREE